MAKKLINILFVHANNKDVGGSDYCLLKLVTSLDRQKFKPTVVLSMRTPIIDLYNKAGISPKILPMKRMRKTKSPLYYLTFFTSILPTILQIKRIIYKLGIKIVHSNDWQDLYGAVAARLSGVKSVQHVRLIITSPIWLKQIISKIILRMNHRVITVSNAVAREMFMVNGRIPPKVVTCYDWLDMESVGHSQVRIPLLKDLSVSSNVICIGVIGRLEPLKGQDLFIKAAANISSYYPQARFFLVGGTVYGRGREKFADELKNLACKLGIGSKVFFLGNRTDIRNIMLALDIIVVPSLWESLPGVALEAMSCSKPVVGFRVGGVPEVIEHDVTGILVAPGNVREMAESIIYLIQNPKIAKEMGQAGYKYVKQNFNRDILSTCIKSIYEDIFSDNLHKFE